MPLSSEIKNITKRIIERSRETREAYLEKIEKAASQKPKRKFLGCANQAHGFAAAPPVDKYQLKEDVSANIAIVTAYNDMLSAHEPYKDYPDLIKKTARSLGAVAQVAGGVPSMCDGITQGFPGMELSLFSRDVIALSTAVALSHDCYDGALYLGICDKIVPGLMIGALIFGHLPAIFVPAGPMTTGQSNSEKAKIRELFAQGKASRKDLLESESKSYHGPGTCTFYGTANSNQMMMEMMGLHMPGAAFIHPYTKLRDALTISATKKILEITSLGRNYLPIGKMIDERSFVNAIVGLSATGGSTNHTIHIIAMAMAAGIVITWDDIAQISHNVPLLARVYPNGLADVNYFHAAGGMGFVIRQLIEGGWAHVDVETVYGGGLESYIMEPYLDHEEKIYWHFSSEQSGDERILRGRENPFQKDGGIRLLKGNLGKAIIKVSALKPEHWVVEAPALVFSTQEEVQESFQKGELDQKDFIAVLRYQGSKANGMPELHKLVTLLAVLQDKGQKVALLTDGRMSGASGKIPIAMHLTPEALDEGPIARIENGDIIRLDAEKEELFFLTKEEIVFNREIIIPDISHYQEGIGRELFSVFRKNVNRADQGAHIFTFFPNIKNKENIS